MVSTLNDDNELRRKFIRSLSTAQIHDVDAQGEATIEREADELIAAIHQRDEARDIASRLDELNHTDGLFECFKTTRMPVMKRVGELRAQLDQLTNPQKGNSNE